MERKVIWNKNAVDYLSESLIYISQTSSFQAENVENGIMEKIYGLLNNPERYPIDKFKKNNPGNYRAFETHSYRVAYHYTETQIEILRIRHVRQEPKSH